MSTESSRVLCFLSLRDFGEEGLVGQCTGLGARFNRVRCALRRHFSLVEGIAGCFLVGHEQTFRTAHECFSDLDRYL